MRNDAFFAAVLLMAGKSLRFDDPIKKLFHQLGNKKVYQWSLQTFLNHDAIDQVYLVIDPEDESKIDPAGAQIVYGGKTRAESSYLGVQSAKEEYVLIHDCARPFVSKKIIDDNIDKVVQFKAVDTAMKACDTIISSDGKQVVDTLNRDKIYHGQTPQSFQKELILDAQENALKQGLTGSCDCHIVKERGHQVYLTKGSIFNFKITHKEDLVLAKLLKQSALFPSSV